jgi:sugar phosphate isomerase/epimerase
MKRRDFIKTSMTTAILPQLEAYATPLSISAQSGFLLKIMATNWGFAGSTEAFCAKAKSAGYDGIEVGYPMEAAALNELAESARKHSLAVGFLVGTWGIADEKKHYDDFAKRIESAVSQSVIKPEYINCHAGKDFYSMQQNQPFLALTDKKAKETGVKIYHETHRGRILYAAPIAKQYIEQYPNMRITADLSHWCCVHESLLEDQVATVNQALDRTDHLHARVGHAEGPQVNDPRAPEWDNALSKHFAWWDKVIERKKRLGETATILTEFGPPDYLPTLPYTRQPIANQWDINVHIMQILRKRYA